MGALDLDNLHELHDFSPTIRWTGNRGQGTSSYRSYDRKWQIETPGKPVIQCSNDPMLGGDPELHNPEDMLISALSACHMLWYLHLASNGGIIVESYEDCPVGYGETAPNGAGRFVAATLRPRVVVQAGTSLAQAEAIHGRVHQYCFIARSVNFPISYEPETVTL